MYRILPLLMLVFAGAVLADPPAWKQAEKAARQERKAEREWQKEQSKAAREARKDRRKAQREWAKDQREAEREWARAQRERQKELRQAQRRLARDGWYDGGRWRAYDEDYRYRDRHWEAIERYQPPRAWNPPPDYEVVVYEPGMRLPGTWVRTEYRIDHHAYGLPPPPPRHQWMQVDDDVVLVALASGLVADFVYDLFE